MRHLKDILCILLLASSAAAQTAPLGTLKETDLVVTNAPPSSTLPDMGEWARTGTVARAAESARLSVPGDADYWLSVEGGTATVWRVEGPYLVPTNSVVILRVCVGAEFGVPPEMGESFLLQKKDGDDFIYTNSWGTIRRPVSGAVPSAYGDSRVWHYPWQHGGIHRSSFSSPDSGEPSNFDVTNMLAMVSFTNTYPIALGADIEERLSDVEATLLGKEGYMTVSADKVLSLYRFDTNGVPKLIWSSSESGGSSVDTNVLNQIYGLLDGKADRAWGKTLPMSGGTNPDPEYMVHIDSPVLMMAAGHQWATAGAHAVLCGNGAIAFDGGTNGMALWGLDLATNYVGFTTGGSLLVGAMASGIRCFDAGTTNGYVEIDYPYNGTDFPFLWFTPQLGTPFQLQELVTWVDNLDGTCTVTAPATLPAGFWRATTLATFNVRFHIMPPLQIHAGIIGDPAHAPVRPNSTITIMATDGKRYRIVGERVP